VNNGEYMVNDVHPGASSAHGAVLRAQRMQRLSGSNLDMVFLVKVKLPVVLKHRRRRLPRASQNNLVVLGTLQPDHFPHRLVKDVAALASSFGVLDGLASTHEQKPIDFL
jgi:hypothetical protein